MRQFIDHFLSKFLGDNTTIASTTYGVGLTNEDYPEFEVIVSCESFQNEIHITHVDIITRNDPWTKETLDPSEVVVVQKFLDRDEEEARKIQGIRRSVLIRKLGSI